MGKTAKKMKNKKTKEKKRAMKRKQAEKERRKENGILVTAHSWLTSKNVQIMILVENEKWLSNGSRYVNFPNSYHN